MVASSTSVLAAGTLVLLCSFATRVCAQAQTFFPAAVPLVAKSTYLNAYVRTSNQSAFPVTWPVFSSNPEQIVGWAGQVRIDGANTTYGWLGYTGIIPATVLNLVVTPTRTIWTLRAGPVDLNVTMLSPIEPGDFVRQSIPFSYMALEVTSNDGRAHSVQVYTDITAEWSDGDRSQNVTWSTTMDSEHENIYHECELLTPLLFTEDNGQASWGTVYYATKSDPSVTWRTGNAAHDRGAFMADGKLLNSQDLNYRTIAPDYPGFAFAYDFGDITMTSQSLVFALGLVHNPAVKYTDTSGLSTQRNLYYTSNFTSTNPGALIDFVLDDYDGALSRAEALDSRLISTAQKAAPGTTLSDLVSLTTRALFGSSELTIGMGADGRPNTSDVMMFVRNTNGDASGRVNAVEQLYSAWPAIMTIDPTLGPALLEPLLHFQQNSDYLLHFAATDLGKLYPNATAANNAHRQGVEMSADMILMAWAHARLSGDGRIISQYYDTLRKWAGYLVDNALYCQNQLDADHSPATNSTNLAIKGILAISAMQRISATLAMQTDDATFQNATQSLYATWKSMALGPNNRMSLTYGASSTWTIGHSLFTDQWLGLGLVDPAIYSGQTAQLSSLLSNSSQATNYGVPTSSGSTKTVNSDNNMMAAAYLSDSNVQGALITRVHNRATLDSANDALPQVYDSSSGNTTRGQFNPAIGAVYAPVALSLTPASSISVPSGPGELAPTSSTRSIAGPIAGGVVGGLAGLALLVATLWLVCSRRRNKSASRVAPTMRRTAHEDPLQTLPSPFPHGVPRHDSDESSGSGSGMDMGPATSAETSQTKLVAERRRRAASAALTTFTAPPGAGGGASSARDSAAELAQQLREEVVNLRREVDEFRAERVEPPPSYAH